MGKMSRRKGYFGEYLFRRLCEENGLTVIWHNEDPTLPDTTVGGLKGEIKYGLNVPKKIYQWFNEKKPDFLAIKRVGKNDKNNGWLAVMDIKTLFRLLTNKKDVVR